MEEEKDKKWSMSISAQYDQKDKTILPELKLRDQIKEESDLNISVSKEKIYAELNVKF